MPADRDPPRHEPGAGDPDPGPGTARVRSHLSGGATHASGGRPWDHLQGAARRTEELADRVRAGMERAGPPARRLTGLLHRLEIALERRSTIPRLVRERPFTSLGVAFGAGFLLATGAGPDRPWLLRQGMSRLRRTVLAALGAAAAAELRHHLLAPRAGDDERSDG